MWAVYQIKPSSVVPGWGRWVNPTAKKHKALQKALLRLLLPGDKSFKLPLKEKQIYYTLKQISRPTPSGRRGSNIPSTNEKEAWNYCCPDHKITPTIKKGKRKPQYGDLGTQGLSLEQEKKESLCPCTS